MFNSRNSKDREIQYAQRALEQAFDYESWLSHAQRLDQLTGGMAWREEVRSPYYPYELLQKQIATIREFKTNHQFESLIAFLQESLHLTLGELSDAHLYNVALTGTKHLIEEYLAEIESVLDYLCDTELEGVSLEQKALLFKHAQKNFGVTALMLSGGGAFGIYHLGIIKSLLREGLLPRVISGTSMGAIVTGLVGTHTDQELEKILQEPEKHHFRPIKLNSLSGIRQHKALMQGEQLLECVTTNIPELSFLEAYKKTGRAINITVSPTRFGQRARILNYKTAPDVLVSYACKASCSIPGVFPATQLHAKFDGVECPEPYMPNELWADGGVNTDIPMGRIGRMHNANHFIVSQTNPHVLPFVVNREKQGAIPFIMDFLSSSVHAQWHQFITVSKKRVEGRYMRFWLDRADALLGQDYLGDINLHPNFPLQRYLKVMANPSNEEIKDFILTGERATWPKLAMIRNQTRISRALYNCHQRAQQKLMLSEAQNEATHSGSNSADILVK